MANRTVSFRLPNEIIDAIENSAKKNKISKTSVIVNVMAQYFGLDIRKEKNLSIREKYNSVEKELISLKLKIEKLEGTKEIAEL